MGWFAKLNQGRSCTANGRVLERHGGAVYISLRVATQVVKVAKKVIVHLPSAKFSYIGAGADSVPPSLFMLNVSSRDIECRKWEVELQLHKTLVKLHVEYGVQFWLSTYRRHVIKLERV